MSIWLLASIGNRDLLVDGQLIPPDAHRDQGKIILEGFHSWERRLSAPQITHCVEYILEQEPRIDSITLFVTDQPGDVPPGFRNKDTIFVGGIVKQLLIKQFGAKIQKIRLASIASGSPAVYDEMYDALGKLISNFPNRSDVDKCYVVPVGGPPAMSSALLLQSCRFFEANCVSLYLREGSARPEPMDFANVVRRNMVRRMAWERLQVDDFAGVENLLASLGTEAEGPKAFAAYANQRLNFNFKAAQEIIEEVMPSLRDAERGLARRLRDALGLFIGTESDEVERMRALIAELYHNASITFAAGRYDDFLGRAVRFEEATLRFLIEQEFGIGTDERKDKGRFARFMEENEPLSRYLRSKSIDGNPLDPKRMNVPVFLNMFRYITEPEYAHLKPTSTCANTLGLSASDRLELARLLGRLDRLRTLRNSSIIAHDFKGVSRDMLMKQYSPKNSTATPLEDMAAVAKLVTGEMSSNPYAEIRSHIQAFLEKP